MSAACAGQPVSWLALERYALGELAAAPAAEVAGHLEACAACRAAFATIDADRDRALPPLPDLALAAARRRRARRTLVAASTALAAAAALLLYWRDRGSEPTAGLKGGELTLSLVRERSGDIAHDPISFRPGDRFQVLVTCADPTPVIIALTVRQGTATDHPLPATQLRCGNRIPLPGSFHLTGPEPATICIDVAGTTDCIDLAPE